MWQFSRITEKEIKSLGKWPDLSLAEAHEFAKTAWNPHTAGNDMFIDLLKDKYVFPSERAGRKIPTDSLRVALRLIGYSTEELRTHGLRGMASTILNESGLWTADAIERQFAHVQGGVRAAYNHAEFLPERISMMQWYADYLWAMIYKNKRGYWLTPVAFFIFRVKSIEHCFKVMGLQIITNTYINQKYEPVHMVSIDNGFH